MAAAFSPGFENNAYGHNYATGGGTGGGGFMSNSQSSPNAGGAKSASAQSMRPVTVRQILNAQQTHTESEILIDGLEVGHVTFVGIIRNLSKNETNIAYNVEDGTGSVDVRAWADNSSTTLMRGDDFQPDIYVRIIGAIKTFNKKRTIQLGHIRVITDFNEVFYHKLDAMLVHLQITRGEAGRNNAMASQIDSKMSESDPVMQIEDPFFRQVMRVVKDLARDDDSNGVPIAVIVRRIPGRSEKDVRSAVDEMIGEGYLYTGMSDEYVNSTV